MMNFPEGMEICTLGIILSFLDEETIQKERKKEKATAIKKSLPWDLDLKYTATEKAATKKAILE